MIRALMVVAMLLVTSPAQATPCWLIKVYYAPYLKQGLKAAEKWARENGYSEADIKEARLCLAKR
jgi:hypothetical protein